MLVNGGGAVTLQFQRSPFKALTRTSYIPWNQIHVIEPVVMASSGGAGISWAEEDTSLKLSYSEPCLPHHFDKMKPLLFSSHQPSWHQGPPYQRTIFADSGVVQEAVQVPGAWESAGGARAWAQAAQGAQGPQAWERLAAAAQRRVWLEAPPRLSVQEGASWARPSWREAPSRGWRSRRLGQWWKAGSWKAALVAWRAVGAAWGRW